MKKIQIIIACIILFSASIHAQNVGIGTTAPSHKLHIKGQVRIDTLVSGLATDSILVADPATGLLKRVSAAKILSGNTTNTLSSSANTMTNTTNGIIATAPIVNTISNTFNSTTRALTTTVNGVAGTSVTLTDGPDSTTASNGLTLTGKDVQLGGSLTAATTVTTSATNTLALAGLQSGAATDSIIVINPANNVIRNVSLATLLNANNMVSTQTITVPALSIGDAGSVTVTIAGATTTSSVVVNPVNDMPNGVAIAYARVSAANTIKIGFVGTGSSASFSSDFLIRVIK